MNTVNPHLRVITGRESEQKKNAYITMNEQASLSIQYKRALKRNTVHTTVEPLAIQKVILDNQLRAHLQESHA